MKKKKRAAHRKLGILDKRPVKMPPWYPKLYDGSLFEKRKDQLILEIVELGGMALIESQCGMSFISDEDYPNCEPMMKALLSIKRKLKSERTKAEAKLEAALANPDDYHFKTKILRNNKNSWCLSGVVTPKR